MIQPRFQVNPEVGQFGMFPPTLGILKEPHGQVWRLPHDRAIPTNLFIVDVEIVSSIHHRGIPPVKFGNMGIEESHSPPAIKENVGFLLVADLLLPHVVLLHSFGLKGFLFSGKGLSRGSL